MSVTLSISSRTKASRNLAAPLKRYLRDVLKLMEIDRGSWSVNLVDDAAMIELHDRTMDMPTTTDVLTFDLRTQNGDAPSLALDLDTVICIDEAVRRSDELGHPLLHEVLLYAIHSLLHVWGFDDRTDAQARKIHRKEDELLVALGVGAVYKR
jgi:probable rRNA maturation factor